MTAKKEPVETKIDIKINWIDEEKPKKYSIHLKTSEDLRRLMSEVVNELRRSEEGSLCARSSRIIQAATVLLNIFQQNDLEKRIQKLEDLNSYGGRG